MLESITAVSRNNRYSKRDNPERYAGYFFFYVTGDYLLSEKSEKNFSVRMSHYRFDELVYLFHLLNSLVTAYPD